ncbi:RNA-directed DNA polymerase-like protein [Gossypium australe]|uniref:RNA-directed DNA polymerase-like protein n=1 Tax=Gossypium australe TaxID=47621 RepID=A0A5B6X2H1_9ROSI|nr:RNA-directed DNA polymerase-like protein [Gossypium australe]
MSKKKTTFITKEGLFCYQVTPFGLKNMGASYQRLIGCGLEVYIDDMLVKNTSMREHMQSLSETFAILRAHGTKLNLEKCVFGLRVHRFLGFMISKRGIEVNSEKI